MSNPDERHPGPRRVRPRREPLFPLEAEDIREPGARRLPPQPLKPELGDLDGVFDVSDVAPRRPLASPQRSEAGRAAQPAARPRPEPPQREADRDRPRPAQPPARGTDQPARTQREEAPLRRIGQPPAGGAARPEPPLVEDTDQPAHTQREEAPLRRIGQPPAGGAARQMPSAEAPARPATRPAAPAASPRPSAYARPTPPAGERPAQPRAGAASAAHKGAGAPQTTSRLVKRAAAQLADDAAAASASHQRYHDTAADLRYAEQITTQPYGWYERRSPLPLANALKLAGVALASLLVIIVLSAPNQISLISSWGLELIGAEPAAVLQLAAQANPPGDYRLIASPSVTPAQIDQILEAYSSPAVGTGQIFYDLGSEYGIDPAFAVAFFIHESSAGTNPRWDGMKQYDEANPRRSTTTHNIGNISCAGYARCLGRWRDYPDWEAGIRDWYKLIAVEYIEGRGHRTVADVIPVYAPSHENDVQGYISAVEQLIDGWRNSGAR